MTQSNERTKPEDIIILEDMETPFGRIKIYESRKDGSRTFYQDACFHSRADKHGNSLIGYIHAMYGLMLQAGAKNIAVLGCAGGTLATMLTRAGCDVTMVDINPESFHLAKRYFRLPASVRCVTGDARQFLIDTRDTFDAIALDVFDAGEIPEHLRSVEFFRLAQSRLKGPRVIVANAIIAHDLDLLADNVAASMEEATGEAVTLYDEMQQPDRNIILAMGEQTGTLEARSDEPEFIRDELRSLHSRSKRDQAKSFRD